MSLIRADQLRLSTGTGAAFPGLQAVNDSGGNGESSIALLLQSSKGVIVGSGGLALDEAGTYELSFGANAGWTFTAGKLSVSGTSFSGTQVANADWVLTQMATGVNWKFPVLVQQQLDNTNDSLNQAIAFYLDGTATAGDTFRISDGVTTETWTGVAGAAGANQFSVDTGANEAMDSLATRINADSTLWAATVATALNSINDGSGTSTAGRVLVVARKDQAAASYNDRIFSNGPNTSQVLWQYVNFNGEYGYTKNTSSQLPSADPAQKEFGPGTQTTDLLPGEAHVDLNGDAQFVWNADGAQWVQISGTGSITAGTGLTKTGDTINIGNGATGNLGGINRSADQIAVAPGPGLQVGTLVSLKPYASQVSIAGDSDVANNPIYIDSTNGINIKIDDSTIGLDPGNSYRLFVKNGGITGTQLNTSVAGLGLTGGGGNALDVLLYATEVTAAGDGDVANNPIYAHSTNGLNIKIDNSTIDLDAGNSYRLYVPAGGITQTQLNTSVAGAGLTGGGGNALDLDLYNVLTTGAGLGDVANNPIYLDPTNGVNIKIDNSTIGLDSGNNDRLYVKNAGITPTQLATSVAGAGLTGGGGNALDLDLYNVLVTSGGNGSVANNPLYLDSTNGLNVKVDNTTIGLTGAGSDFALYVPNGGITETQLNTSVAGLGLNGGGGNALDLALYATEVSAAGDGDVANNPIYADTTNGINIKIDGSTIDLDAGNSYRLYIPNGGVTETQLNASVAGTGLTGGGGSALSIDTGSTVNFSADTPVWTFGNETTGEGLFVTGTPQDANHVVNKSYVDSVASGLAWQEPAAVLKYIGNVESLVLIGNYTIAGINGLTPTTNDTVVATDAGTPTAGTSDALVAGSVAYFDGTSWKEIVAGSGGFVPVNTYIVLSTTTALTSPYTDGVDDGKIAYFDGSTNTGALTTPVIGQAVVVKSTTVKGNLVQFHAGTTWATIVTNSGGFPPAATRVVIDYPSAGVALLPPLTDNTDEGKIADFSGASLTPTLTTPLDGWAILINGETATNENNGFVYDGTVPGGNWVQFTGAGQINAGTGLTKTGNTINANAADTSITMNANDFGVNVSTGLEINAGVRLSAQGNGIGGGAGSLLSVTGYAGIAVDANGVNVDLTTNGGLQFSGAGSTQTVGVKPSYGVSVGATGVALKLDTGAIRTIAGDVSESNNPIYLDSTNGLNIMVDDTTLSLDAANDYRLYVKPLGIDTPQLAANAVTIAKLGIQFNEEDIPASGFSAADPSVQTGTLAQTALVDANGYGYVELYRNGVADMLKQATGTSMGGTGANKFKIQAGGTKVEIGANINGSGNTYRVRYLSAL